MLTRRHFAHVLGATAVAAAMPRLTLAEAPLKPKGIARLNANENPYGPSQAAMRAITDAFPRANRYPDEAIDALVADIARFHGLSNDSILCTDGSSEALKVAATTFAQKRLVTAEPTFEAIGFCARSQGAEIVKVALTSTHAHDLARMLDAAKGEGLIYVCNPNNPTATITPKAAVRALLANAPASVTILIDEAYHHYADSPDYESVIPLVRSYPNLVVTRTFSKIYGMAGLRCGYAVAQPATIEKMQNHGQWDSVNVFATAAARASLADPMHVELGRKRNREAKTWLANELSKIGYQMLPSDANFVMIHLRREVRPVIDAMHKQGIDVGRPFPPMTQYLRLSIGTPEEMTRFVEAFRTVMT
jgi:histidinol-phosphate aminotransferase